MSKLQKKYSGTLLFLAQSYSETYWLILHSATQIVMFFIAAILPKKERIATHHLNL